MTLTTTVTWTFETSVDDEYFNEMAKENEERFIYDEVIGRIEGRIDNLCLSNWSRDNVTMNWEG